MIIDFGEGSRLIRFTVFKDMDTKLARSTLPTLTLWMILLKVLCRLQLLYLD